MKELPLQRILFRFVNLKLAINLKPLYECHPSDLKMFGPFSLKFLNVFKRKCRKVIIFIIKVTISFQISENKAIYQHTSITSEVEHHRVKRNQNISCRIECVVYFT